jgi:signal transduction histidine kinase
VFGAVSYRQQALTHALLEARERLTSQAVTNERRRIAREVHDLVGHSLTVVLLHVTGARHLLRRDVDEAERALVEAERAGRENLAEIRRTVALLRDEEGFGTTPTPGARDLADLVQEYRRGGLRVDFVVEGDTDSVDEVTGLTLYRVAQESLANVAKHAPDGHARVGISVGRDRTTIEVVNTVPRRTSASRAEGVGIVGMHERARATGGTLVSGPTATGWAVMASFPRCPAEASRPEQVTTS